MFKRLTIYMKCLALICIIAGLLCVSATNVFALACNDQADGDYDNPATWDCGVTPDDDDDVTIDSHTVDLDSDETSNSVTISGGVLNLNTFTLGFDTTWTYSSGTFNPGTGTVDVNTGATALTSPGVPFYNLLLGANFLTDLTVTGTVEVSGTFTISNMLDITGDNYELSGDAVFLDGGVGGVSEIHFVGMGDQRITAGGGTGDIPNITVNKPGGTLTIEDTIRLQQFTHITGTVDAGSSTVIIVQEDISTTLTGGSDGDFTFNNLTLALSSGTITTTGTVNVTGTMLVTTVGIYDGSGTFAVQGDLYISDSSANASASTNLIFNGSGDQLLNCTVSGCDIAFIDWVINKPGGTLFLIGDDITIAGDLIHIAGDVDGGTSSVSWANTSNTVATFGSGNFAFNDVLITKNAITLTITGTMNIDGDFELNLIFQINGGVITVAGDLTSNSDSNIDGTTEIVLDGSNDQTITTGSGADYWTNGDWTINKSGGTVTLASNNFSLDGALFVQSGTLDLAGFDITIGGNFDVDDGLRLKGDETITVGGAFTIDTATSTIEYYDNTVTALVTDFPVSTFNNLTFGEDKVHEFATGMGNEITVNGVLASQGTQGTASRLQAESDAASDWFIDLQGSSTLSNRAIVRHSNATSGISVIAGNSVDRGDNTNWNFMPNVDPYIWVGDGNANTYSDASHWSGGVLPSSTDTIILTGTLSVKDLNIDTDVTFAGIEIRNGYSGTITQNSGQTITVNGDWIQRAGVFIGGDSNIDINGSFGLFNTASFTETSGTMGVSSTFTIASGATYNPQGTLVLDGDLNFADNRSSSIGVGNIQIGSSPDTTTLTTDLTGTNLLIDTGDVLITDGYEVTMSGTITINGHLNATSGTDGNTTINVGGGWAMSSGMFTSTDTTVIFTGTSSTATFGINAETYTFNNVKFDDSGGGTTWQLQGTLAVDGTFQLNDGILDTNSSENHHVTITGESNLTGGSLLANASTIFFKDDWDMTGGSFTPSSSQVFFTGTQDAILASGGNSFYDLGLNDGLVGYWKFEESSAGASAVDSSGFGHTGVAGGSGGGNNLPQPTTDISTTIKYSNTRGLDFDGSDDSITTPDTSELSLTQDLTMAVWVYAESEAARWRQIICKQANATHSNPYCNYSLWINTGDDWYLRIDSNTVNWADATFDQWVHIACTRDASATRVRCYENGVEKYDNSTWSDDPNDSAYPLWIGNNLNDEGFLGMIDDVRIYNRVLSPTEIAALAAGNQPQTGMATLTLEDTLDVTGSLIINSGTLDVNSAEDNAVSVAGNWINNGGDFIPQNGTVTLDGTDQEMNASGTFYNLTKTETSDDSTDSTLTIGRGSTQTITNTLTLDGLDSDDLINIRSSTTGSIHIWDVTSGDQTVSYLDVQDSNASSNDITASNSTNSGNNDDADSSPFWIFAANPITLSGDSNLPDSTTVRWAQNTTLRSHTTTVITGSFSMAVGGTISTGDVITVWAEGVDNDIEATAVTEYQGSGDVSGLYLYSGTLSMGHTEGTMTLLMTELGQYDNNDDEDILYVLSAGNTLQSAITRMNLYIQTGTFDTDGYEMEIGGTMQIDGTLDATSGNGGSSTIEVGGGWIGTTGTFLNTDSTVIFTGTLATDTFGLYVTSAKSFDNVKFDDSGGGTTWELQGTMTVDGTFELTDGIVDTNSTGNYGWTNTGTFRISGGLFNANASTLTAANDFLSTVDDLFDEGTGTVDLIGTGDLQCSNAVSVNHCFYNLNVAASGQITTLVNKDFSIGNLLTIGSGEFADSGFRQIGLENLTSIPISIDPSSTISIGNFTYFAGTGSLAAGDYQVRVTLRPSSETYELTGTFAAGSLIISDNSGSGYATVDTTSNNYPITLDGGLTLGRNANSARMAHLILNASTLTIGTDLKSEDAGTFNIIEGDTATINVGGDWDASEGLTMRMGTSTVVFNANSGTSTIMMPTTGTVATFGNILVDDGDGGSDLVVQMSGTLDMTGSLRITDGSFVSDGYEMFIDGNVDIDDELDLSSGTHGNTTMEFGGDWDMTGATFTSTDSSVFFTGTMDATLTSDTKSFDNFGINDGLIAYWSLNESSAPFKDEIYDNDAVVDVGAPTSIDGVFNTAIDFNGSSALEADSTLNYRQLRSMTIAYWVNFDDFVGYRGMVDVVGLISILTSFNTANIAVLADGWSAQNGNWLSVGGSVVVDTWHHIAVTYDYNDAAGTFPIVYIDGVRQALAQAFASMGSLETPVDGTVNIGTVDFSGARRLNGTMDDVRIYNREISAAEVRWLADNTKPQTGTATLTLEDTLDVTGSMIIHSGTLDVNSAEDNAISVAGNWENNGGDLDPQNGTVTLDGSDQTITGSTTFYNLTKTESTNDGTDVTLTVGSRTTQTVENTLTLDGLDDDDRINIRSTITGSFHIWDVTGGDQTASFLDVQDSHASSNDIAVTQPIDSGNTDSAEASPHWVLGTIISGTTNLPDTTLVRWAENSTLRSNTAVVSGGSFAMSVTGTIGVGSVITVWADGVADNLEATAVTEYQASGDVTGLILQSGTLSMGHTEGTMTLTMSELGQYDNNDDEDIIYVLTAGTTLQGEQSVMNMLIQTGTFTTDGYEIDIGGTIRIEGTLNAESGAGGNTTINLGGSWSNADGLFTAGTSTVVFDGTTTGLTLSGTLGGSSAFYQVTFDGSGGEWTVDGTMQITSENATDTLMITTGTLVVGNGGNDALASYGMVTIASGGAFVTNQTLTQSTGTVTIDINSNPDTTGTINSCDNCIVSVSGTLDIGPNTVFRLNPRAAAHGSASYTGIEVEASGYFEARGSLDVSGSLTAADSTALRETNLCTDQVFTDDEHNGKHVRISNWSSLAFGRVHKIVDTRADDTDCATDTHDSIVIADHTSATDTNPNVSGGASCSGLTRCTITIDDSLITANDEANGRYLHNLTDDEYYLIVDSTEAVSDLVVILSDSPDDIAGMDDGDDVEITDGIRAGDSFEVIDYAHITAEDGLDCTASVDEDGDAYIYLKAGSESLFQYSEACNLGDSAGGGTKTGIYSDGVDGGNSNEGITLTKNFVHDGYNGIHLDDSSNNNITGNTLEDNSLYGINVVGASNNFTMNTNLADQGGRGININGGVNGVISYNLIQANNALSLSMGGGVTNHRFINNTIQSNSSYGIYMSTTKGALVSNNLVRGNGTGGVYILGASDSNILAGNIFKSISGSTILLLNDDGTSNIFVGNTGFSTTNGISGINITSNDNRFIGHTVYDATGAGLRLSGTSVGNIVINGSFGILGDNDDGDIEFTDSSEVNVILYNTTLSSSTGEMAGASADQYVMSFNHDGTMGLTRAWGEFTSPSDIAETPQNEAELLLNYSEGSWPDSFTAHEYSGGGTEDTDLDYTVDGAIAGSSDVYVYRLVCEDDTAEDCDADAGSWSVYRYDTEGNETQLADADYGVAYVDGTTNIGFKIDGGGATDYDDGDVYTFVTWKGSTDTNTRKTLTMMNTTGTLNISGTIEMLGDASYPTIIQKDAGATDYDFIVSGTINASEFVITDTGSFGLMLTESATVIALSSGTFDSTAGTSGADTYLRISGTLIDNDGPRTFTNLIFDGGAADGNVEHNVTLINNPPGGCGNQWTFESTGNLGGSTNGEANDNDSDGDCGGVGYLLFIDDAGQMSITGTTNLADSTTLRWAQNATLRSHTALVLSGSFAFDVEATLSAGDMITVWADGVGDSLESTAITKYHGSGNVTGMMLDSGTLGIGHNEGTFTITMTDLGQYDNNDDEDIVYVLTAGNTLDSVESLMNLIISTGTFSTDGYDMDINGTIDIDGTLNAASGAGGDSTINAAGSWYNSGVFTKGSSTVIFDGTTDGLMLSGTLGGSSAFYQVDFNGSGGEWTVDGTFEITSANATDTLMITTGTLIVGNGGNDSLISHGMVTIASGGAFVTNQTLTQSTGTVTIDINDNNGGSPPSCANCIVSVSGTLDIGPNTVFRLNPVAATSYTGIEVEASGYLEVSGSINVTGSLTAADNVTLRETNLCSDQTYTDDEHNGKHIRITNTSSLVYGRIYKIQDTIADDSDCATNTDDSVVIADTTSGSVTYTGATCTTALTCSIVVDDTLFNNTSHNGQYIHNLTDDSYYLIQRNIESGNDSVVIFNNLPDDFTDLDNGDLIEITDGIRAGDSFEIIDFAHITAENGAACDATVDEDGEAYIYLKAGSNSLFQNAEACNLGDATGGSTQFGISVDTVDGDSANEGITMAKSYVHSGYYGIYFDGSSNNTVNYSLFEGNDTNGITLTSSTENTITANILQENSASAITVGSGANKNTITNNVSRRNGGGFGINGRNNSFSGNTLQGDGSGFLLNTADNNVLIANIVQSNVGASLSQINGANNNVISGNIFRGARSSSLNLTSSFDNAFISNEFYSNAGGHNLSHADNNRFIAESLDGNGGAGILVGGNSSAGNMIIHGSFGTVAHHGSGDLNFSGTNAHSLRAYNVILDSATEVGTGISDDQFVISYQHDGTLGGVKVWGEYTSPTDDTETPQNEALLSLNYTGSLWPDSFSPHGYIGSGTEDTDLDFAFNGALAGSSDAYVYRITCEDDGTTDCDSAAGSWDVFRYDEDGTETTLTDADFGVLYTDGTTNVQFKIDGGPGYATGDTYTFVVWKSSQDTDTRKTLTMMTTTGTLNITGTIEMLGDASYPTIIQKDSGATDYDFIITGTINADEFTITDTGSFGLMLDDNATITALTNGTFDSTAGTSGADTYLRISSTLIDNVGARTFEGLTFDAGGADGNVEYNVTLVGTPSSCNNQWTFESGGNLGGFTNGEANDSDLDTSCSNRGYLIFHDVGGNIVFTGNSNLPDSTTLRWAQNSTLRSHNAMVLTGSFIMGVGGTISPGDVITLWADGVDNDVETTAVTEYQASGDVSGLYLYSGTLSFGHTEGTMTLLMTELGQYDNNDDEDILYVLSAGNTLQSSISRMNLYIKTGTFDTDGYELEVGGTMQIDGTLDATSGNGGNTTIEVGGGWIGTTGTFLNTDSTVIFTGTLATDTFGLYVTSAKSLDNVKFDDSGGGTTWELQGTMTVDGTFQLTDGIVDTNSASSYGWTNTGTFRIVGGQFRANASTITAASDFLSNATNAFVQGTSLVDLTGSGNLQSRTVTGGVPSIYDINVAAAGQTTTVNSLSLSVGNSITVGTGTLTGAPVALSNSTAPALSIASGGVIEISYWDYAVVGANVAAVDHQTDVRFRPNTGTYELTGSMSAQSIRINTSIGANNLATLDTTSNNYSINTDGNITIGIGGTGRVGRFITNSSTVNIGGDLIFDTQGTVNTLIATAGTFNVAGDWNVSDGGTMRMGTSTVVFNGTTGTSTISFPTTGTVGLFGNILVNDGDGGSDLVVQMSGTLDMTGSLRITDGSFVSDGYEMFVVGNVDIDDELDLSSGTHGNTTMYFGGDWDMTGGTFTSTDSTVVFTTTTEAAVTLTSDTKSFNNFYLNEDGLVAHWSFDDADINNRVTDTSGNDNHGSATSTLIAVNGQLGQALDFNGQQITAGSASSLDNIEEQRGDGMTITAWVNPDAIDNLRMIAEKGEHNVAAGEGDWQFSIATNGRLRFNKGYDTTVLDVQSASSSVSVGSWQAVAMTWDGSSSASNVHFYVNGTEVGSYVTQTDGATTKISDASDTMILGSTGSNDYDGKIDDIRIYNRILSTTEIADLARGFVGASGSVTLSDTLTATGTLINDRTLDLNGQTLIVTNGFYNTGTFQLQGDETITLGTDGDLFGVALYDGSVTATLDDELTGYRDLVFDWNDPSATLTLPDIDLSVTGSFTILDGRVSTDDDKILTVQDATIADTFIMGASDVRVSGFWDASGGIFTTTGTIMFTSTESEQITSNSNTFNNVIINDGLVGYWKFDETTGTLSYDSSGHEITGTWIDGVNSITSIPTVNFANERAVNFPGSADFIDFGDSEFLDFGTGDFTISFWITRFASTASYDILGKRLGSYAAGAPGFAMGIDFGFGDGVLVYEHTDGTGEMTIIGSTRIDDSAWHHVAVVVDRDTSANTIIYVDGADDVGSRPATAGTGSINNNLSFRVGNLATDLGGVLDFLGSIDDLRFYDRALSSAEVQALANGNQPQTGLGTFTLQDAFDVDGTLMLNSGTLDVGSDNAITIAGNWINNGGDFVAQTGTVTFDGTDQAIHSSETFYHFDKSGTMAATMTFGQGSTITIDGSLTLTGTLGQLLSLRSSTDGTRFTINTQTATSVSYVDVKDSQANETDITADVNSVNSGNTDKAEATPHWVFVGSGPLKGAIISID